MRCFTRRALARLILGAAVLCGCEPFGGTTTIVAGSPSVGLVADTASLSLIEGETGMVGLRLAEDPRGRIVVEVVLDAAGPFSVTEGGTLTFDSSNWDTTQYITIAAVGDTNTSHDRARLRVSVGGEYYMSINLAEVDNGSNEPPLEEDPPAEEPPAEEPPPTPGTPPPPVPPVDPGEPQDGIPFTVKDASGLGAIDYPVTAVIPLSYGIYQNTTNFRVVDGQGTAIPAQIEVLNRWGARDNSIRHVAVHFQASVSGAGKSHYALQTNAAGPAPAKSVTLTQNASVVTVDTGAVKFTVKKTGFNLFDEVWLDTNNDGAYAASERIVAPSESEGPVLTDRNGAKQRASDRSDLKVVVEESGPMRCVLRVSALTKFNSAADHKHGFAVRITAYAGKSFVKVDYQLQNSAKNVRYGAPLFFDDVSLHVKPTLSSPTVRLATGPGNIWSGSVASGRTLLQNSLTASTVGNSGGGSLLSGTNPPVDASCGWGDISDSNRGVFVAIRHMAEMWPNCLEVESDGDVAVRLWPKQSSQYHEGKMSTSGLYWLEDMQQVYKETLFYFHGANASSTDLDRLAKTFQYHPIPFVAISEYARTKVTLDVGGVVPISEPISGTDTRRILIEPAYVRDRYIAQGNDQYNFGWMNFMGDVQRKIASVAGGVSYSAAQIVATERVDHWLTGEANIIGELNCRPQWLAEYKYDTDYALLQPSQDPYAGRSWRAHVTGSEPDLPNQVDYLAGTGWGGWKPRDNEHAWYYHVEEFYWLSANPWVRDWYEFIGEFRKTERSNPGLANWSFLSIQGWEVTRGEAHGISNAMQAYRVTGDAAIIEWMRVRLKNLRDHRDPQFGTFSDGFSQFNVGGVYEHGYLARALIQLFEEVEGHDRDIQDQCFNHIWGIIEWNHGHATYGYFVQNRNPDPYPIGSSGSAMVMVDPHAWFCWKFGAPKYLSSLNGYLDGGLNGGRGPYIDIADVINWNGASLGRPSNFVRKYPPLADGPTAVTNLSARSTSGKIEISFTAPARSVRAHVVWSDKPLTAIYTKEEGKRNMWAGTPVPNTLALTGGSTSTLQFSGAPSGKTIYVAVIAFDANGHMSPASNVATVTAP